MLLSFSAFTADWSPYFSFKGTVFLGYQFSVFGPFLRPGQHLKYRFFFPLSSVLKVRHGEYLLSLLPHSLYSSSHEFHVFVLFCCFSGLG